MLEFICILACLFASSSALLFSCAACRVAVMNRQRNDRAIEEINTRDDLFRASVNNQLTYLRANIADLRITVKERREALEKLLN